MATPHYFLVLWLACCSVALAKNIFPTEDFDRLIDPFSPGEYPINHTAYRQALSLFLDTNIDVYAPNATGNFPVFYFITGFGGIIRSITKQERIYFLFKKWSLNHFSGLVPAEAHTELFSQIATHGIVVVAVWKVGSPETSFDPAWFAANVDFVEKRLENSLHNQEGKRSSWKIIIRCQMINVFCCAYHLGYVSDFHVDYLHSFIGGHSAGNHAAVAQLQVYHYSLYFNCRFNSRNNLEVKFIFVELDRLFALSRPDFSWCRGWK